MTDPNFLSVKEAILQIKNGFLTPESLTQACSRQIERLNPLLNAFITLCTDGAAGGTGSASGANGAGRDAAQRSALLPGIPIAVKDLFETKGIRTTAGSLFFKDYVPAQDAVVVQKLRGAGAVILGKTNTHEIALGVTSNNPHFGACLNPWDTARIPGGSSGGSAVAVATGMALAALGSDTGGSIRIPAALCGVVGLKPTYGRVSLRGAIPLSWNLDHVGSLTRTVGDAALILQVIAGYDADDPYSSDRPVDDYSAGLEDGVAQRHIALAIGDYFEDLDADVLQAYRGVAEVFEKLDAKVEKVDVSFLRDAALANGIMVAADGAAYHRERLAEHPDWFGADVRQRLETGRSFTSTDYILARRTQAEMKGRLNKFFQQYDVLLLPATPIAAPLIEGNDAVEQARRLTRFTAPFNLTGLPAISVPCGFTRAGLPIGLQIVSCAWNEAAVLRTARAYERDTNWGVRRPPAG
jgi:aspartyl-tRNA(Asn)/glutamyl-tRNA(Gln) amidotransferase subunit A